MSQTQLTGCDVDIMFSIVGLGETAPLSPCLEVSNAAGSSLHFNAYCEALGVWSTDLHFQRRVTQRREISDLSALTTDALTDINDSYQIYFHIRRSPDSNPTIPRFMHQIHASLAYRAVVQIIHPSINPSATLAPPCTHSRRVLWRLSLS